MGCAASSMGDAKLEGLRAVLEPRFAETLHRDRLLQASLQKAFPRGLREPVSRRVLFGALRLEPGVLEERLYGLLEECGAGVPNLEDVLRALACVAAGHPIRSQAGAEAAAPSRRLSFSLRRLSLSPRRGNSSFAAPQQSLPPPPPPLPPSAWNDRFSEEGGVSKLRALFAFEMYDLNGDGSINAHEVTQLVTRTLAGNARAVHTTLRAVGATRHGRLRAPSFAQMCAHAPNFVYPAYALQEQLLRGGMGAAAALEALRSLFEGMVTPVRKERPGERSRSRSPSPQRQQQHASVAPAAPPTPPSAPPLSPELREALVARAFRAARMGRAADVEAALASGAFAADVAFEPHRATLLHVAAAHGHRGLCRRLLALGAPPRARDALGRSAAEVALAYRHWATADALRAAGVPVSQQAAAHAAAEAAEWEAQQGGGADVAFALAPRFDDATIDAEWAAEVQEAAAPPPPRRAHASAPPAELNVGAEEDEPGEQQRSSGGAQWPGDGTQAGAWQSRRRRKL